MIELSKDAISNFFIIWMFLSGFFKMITIDSRAALMLEIEQMEVIEV